MTAGFDRDGRFHATSWPISKANICPYRGRELFPSSARGRKVGLKADRVYRMLRSPAALEKAAAGFRGVPLLSQHPAGGAFDANLVVGSIGTKPRFSDPYLLSDVTVWSADAIDDILSGRKASLSAGYSFAFDMTPGTHAGQRYDGVIYDIKADHCALVSSSRAGPDMALPRAA